MTEIEKVTAVKRRIQQLKAENPELAAKEDARQLPGRSSNIRASQQQLEDEVSPVPHNVPLDSDGNIEKSSPKEGGEMHEIAPLEVN